MTVGHIDTGSALSMSMLLSHAHAVEGGKLMTWSDEGLRVEHAMERGDALLFESETMHNVSPITRGERFSLVVELWQGPTNETNRYT